MIMINVDFIKTDKDLAWAVVIELKTKLFSQNGNRINKFKVKYFNDLKM